VSEPPGVVEMNDVPGDDSVSCWKNYVEAIYQIYLSTVARGRLQFRGKKVQCQFRPETDGKHFA
jgi:hypothetical protein